MIKISSELCDIELTDMSKSNSIDLADFRNVPWDISKSFYFGANQSNVKTGEKYTFKYRIRLLPPTTQGVDRIRSATVLSPVDRLNALQESKDARGYGSEVFFPLPAKKETYTSDYNRLSGVIQIYTDQMGTEIDILADELTRLPGTQVVIHPLETGVTPDSGIILQLKREIPEGVVPQTSEWFGINIGKHRIVLSSSHKNGRLYGVYKLLSLMETVNHAWQVKCGTIIDWPDLHTRGMLIEILPPATHDIDLFKRYIDALSRARTNLIIFWQRPADIAKWKTSSTQENWSKNNIKQIASYARDLYMDVWGGVTYKVRPDQPPYFDVADETGYYNPFDDKSYSRLFSLYEELIDCYNPTGIVTGHDEIKGLNVYSEKSGISPDDILVGDVKRIHEWLSARGLRTIMPGDMLLDNKKWTDAGGAVNSRNPQYDSGATHLALYGIPKDVIILDWHYGKSEDYPTLQHFRKNGYDVLGDVWYDPEASKIMAESVKKAKGIGIIGSDFGFWRTLSPAATTLYAPLCGWSSGCAEMEEDDADLTTLVAF